MTDLRQISGAKGINDTKIVLNQRFHNLFISIQNVFKFHSLHKLWVRLCEINSHEDVLMLRGHSENLAAKISRISPHKLSHTRYHCPRPRLVHISCNQHHHQRTHKFLKLTTNHMDAIKENEWFLYYADFKASYADENESILKFMSICLTLFLS